MLICKPESIFQNHIEIINMTIFDVIYQLYGREAFTFDDFEDFIQEIFKEKDIETGFSHHIEKGFLFDVLEDFQKLKLISKEKDTYLIEETICKLFIEIYLDNDQLGLPTLKKVLQEIYKIDKLPKKQIIDKNIFEKILKKNISKNVKKKAEIQNMVLISYSWLLYTKHIVITSQGIKINKLTIL